jgi:hypothetical protein
MEIRLICEVKCGVPVDKDIISAREKFLKRDQCEVRPMARCPSVPVGSAIRPATTIVLRVCFFSSLSREGSFRLPWFGSGHFICNRVPKAMNTSFSILLQNGAIPPEH